MKRLRQQRGSMLLVVLFFVGLLGFFAAAAAVVMRSAEDASRTFGGGLRAEEAMRGAMNYIIGQTGEDILSAHGTAAVQMGRTKVFIRVRDEAARIDLNHAPARLLAGIFQQVGVPAQKAAMYAARVIDWRDPDDKLSPHGGAELAAYRAVGRTDGPRNGPFLSVAELALVLGIPKATAAAVAPYVTVANGRAKVNPIYADPPVLLAIPGVTPDAVRDFLQARKKPGIAFKPLVSRLGVSPAQKFVTQANGLAVSFDGRVVLRPGSQRRYEVVATVDRGDSRPFRILSWTANPPRRMTTMPQVP